MSLKCPHIFVNILMRLPIARFRYLLLYLEHVCLHRMYRNGQMSSIEDLGEE